MGPRNGALPQIRADNGRNSFSDANGNELGFVNVYYILYESQCERGSILNVIFPSTTEFDLPRRNPVRRLVKLQVVDDLGKTLPLVVTHS